MAYSPFLDEFGGLGSPAGGMSPMMAALRNNQQQGSMPFSLAPQIPMPAFQMGHGGGSQIPGGAGPQPQSVLSQLSELSRVLGGGGSKGGGSGGGLGSLLGGGGGAPFDWTTSTGLFGGQGSIFGPGGIGSGNGWLGELLGRGPQDQGTWLANMTPEQINAAFPSENQVAVQMGIDPATLATNQITSTAPFAGSADWGAAIPLGADAGPAAASMGPADAVALDAMAGGTAGAAAGGSTFAELLPLIFWVICSELNRQGLMADDLYRASAEFALRLPKRTIDGYHLWAKPLARLMRRSKFATRLVRPLAIWRAKEILYRMGKTDTPCWPGKIIRWIGEPACYAIGYVLERLDRHAASEGARTPSK